MVYHGPSSGCKTCRTRRIKCDCAKPACTKCLRRGQTCPGYADVFDGAHRSQNRVVQRQIARQNGIEGVEHPDLGESSRENGLETYSKASSSPTNTNKTSPRWVVYSTAEGQSWSAPDTTDLPAAWSPAPVVNVDLNTSALSIPSTPSQNAQDASLCFFFRHYAGTAFDPEARDGFNQMWQPMYLQASARSSLRLATVAVTVNIAMMWSSRGYNSRPARSIFTQAVATAREALNDPLQILTDETLMTILIFDLYEALALHYAPDPLEYGKHKHGALAIIEHRGFAMLATPRGRALIAAIRHSLLPYLLSMRRPFPEQLEFLFDHPTINNTKASHLDLISARLSRVQSRLWTLRLGNRLDISFEERRTSYEEVIVEAFQIEEFLLAWEAGISEPDWLPEHVSRGSVLKSIQDAGFYGPRCSIWVDLDLGGIWNLFFIRYLLTLQVIRQSFADEPSLLDHPEQRTLLSKVNQSVQNLVDSICETIPFHLGDNINPKNPMHSTSINFPYTIKTDQRSKISTRIPSLKSNHHSRAAASGGWILFPQLVNVWRLGEPEDDSVPIVLREGQLDWIKQQVKRLQKIFLFCEPVWFKRITPNLATSSTNEYNS